MKEVESLPKVSYIPAKLFEVSVLLILMALACYSDQDQIAAICGLTLSLIYIFHHSKSAIWIYIKAVILGYGLFTFIELIYAVNIYNKYGASAVFKWSTAEYSILGISGFSIWFSLFKFYSLSVEKNRLTLLQLGTQFKNSNQKPPATS